MSKYSEALKQLGDISYFIMEAYSDHEPLKENQRDSRQCFMNYCENIKQTLIKAQEQEKENELLKEIIKSLFDRGCPLHQYIDYELGLAIEVDRRCSIVQLGVFKGVNLNKKLKEVFCDDEES